MPKKPIGYWTESRVIDEIRLFAQEHGIQGRMPREAELRQHGRGDLVTAIIRYGRLHHFSHLMSLPIVSPRSEIARQDKKRKMRVELEDWMIPPL